jgi:hypothetical protein
MIDTPPKRSGWATGGAGRRPAAVIAASTSTAVAPVEVGEQQQPVRAEHPADLGEQLGLPVAVQVVEHQRGEHPVDGTVGLRELLGEPDLEAPRDLRSGRLPPSPAQRRRVRVEAGQLHVRMPAAERDEQVPGAAADVQHPLPRPQLGAVDQVVVQPADAGQPLHRVVEREQPV